MKPVDVASRSTTPLPAEHVPSVAPAGSWERTTGVPGSRSPRPGLLAPFPKIVWLFAFAAALLHIAPFWHAESSQRDGWTFTENLTVSPDHMQYRVWARQTMREGPLITNRFTTEPNRAHLPVLFFWAVGKTANVLGVSPDRVLAYAGSLFAALLTLLVFAAARHFLPDPRHAWWAFAAVMLGGGLGGHLKLMQSIPGLAGSGPFVRFVSEPIDLFPVFEDYRNHYVIKSLLDTHSLFLWVVALAAVLALYAALDRFSWPRATLTASLFALLTVLHIYEGVTLVAIVGAVTLTCWRFAERRRSLVTVLASCTVAVGLCYLVLGALFARSGLPFPSWRAINILLSTLLIAYPLAWGLIAFGLRDYWLRAGFAERFLVGWAAGCTLVTLSGPFFPYPDRGVMTMAVPLYLIAAAIFFSRWSRVSLRQAALAVALLGATPFWLAVRAWHFSGFRTDAPFQFVNESHRRVQRALAAGSDTSDILLAEPPSLLWLAPEFPGRLYVGHFFLTVDFAGKAAALGEALADPARLPALLDRSGATLLFVSAERRPERLRDIPGLVPIATEPVGWLFRHTATGAHAGR